MLWIITYPIFNGMNVNDCVCHSIRRTMNNQIHLTFTINKRLPHEEVAFIHAMSNKQCEMSPLCDSVAIWQTIAKQFVSPKKSQQLLQLLSKVALNPPTHTLFLFFFFPSLSLSCLRTVSALWNIKMFLKHFSFLLRKTNFGQKLYNTNALTHPSSAFSKYVDSTKEQKTN